MAFEITPVTTFPPTLEGEAPPKFIQFQWEGVNVGDQRVATVNFTGTVNATLSLDRGKLTLGLVSNDIPIAVSSGALLLVGNAPSVTATAEPAFFFGEELNGDPNVAVVPPINAPLSARNAFLAAITNPGLLDFESYIPTGAFAITPLGPFNFAAPQASVSVTLTTEGVGVQGTFEVSPYGTTDGFGRYNTTPPAGTNIVTFVDNVTITLSTPKYALGFYGTDFGDFDGQMKALITDSLGGTFLIDIPHSIGSSSDGALIFWGVRNWPNPIASIKLYNVIVSGPSDACGIDDIIVGDL